MQFNLATTISFCAAATCSSSASLGAYLSLRPSSRHFRFAVVAGFAGALYCLTDAVLAAHVSVEATVAAGRVGVFAMMIHGAAWIAFVVAWRRRAWSRLERATVVANVLAGLIALVPGVVATSTLQERTVAWLGITYRDPDVGPLGAPIAILSWCTHVLAALAARRARFTTPRATMVSYGLLVFCVVIPLDLLSAMHVLGLPYLADPAVAGVLLSVGAVVVADAADSAEKSVQLERARVTLAERENLAALGQLAAVVAHEVRNPVAIIYGALSTLQKPVRTEDESKLLGIIGEEAVRLKELTTRLLDAVRPFDLQYSRASGRALVDTAVARALAGAGVPSSEAHVTHSSPDEVECDEVMLVHAIANLVENAILATGRRSPVRVRATTDLAEANAFLRIEVADDGHGVPVESRARLFTPFFTTRATGTGLGLVLVKRIAVAHGGTVDYQPSDGEGASFVLRVPLRAAKESPHYLSGDDLR